MRGVPHYMIITVNNTYYIISISMYMLKSNMSTLYSALALDSIQTSYSMIQTGSFTTWSLSKNCLA